MKTKTNSKTFVRNVLFSTPYLKAVYGILCAQTIGFERHILRNFKEPLVFYAPPGNLSENWVAMDRESKYEAPLLERFLQSLGSDSVVLDVGASVGIYTLIAGKETENIHCFEPEPFSAYLLRKNIRYANVNATIVPKFVGDKDSLKTITVDTYCQRKKISPTHIKIDIEGYEMLALRGMTETLTRCKPKLFIEFHEELIKRQLGFNKQDINNFFGSLKKHGYNMIFNSHLYQLSVTRNKLYTNFEWYSVPPNNVIYACIAECPSN